MRTPTPPIPEPRPPTRGPRWWTTYVVAAVVVLVVAAAAITIGLLLADVVLRAVAPLL